MERSTAVSEQWVFENVNQVKCCKPSSTKKRCSFTECAQRAAIVCIGGASQGPLGISKASDLCGGFSVS
jgi:hypothetical protein